MQIGSTSLVGALGLSRTDSTGTAALLAGVFGGASGAAASPADLVSLSAAGISDPLNGLYSAIGQGASAALASSRTPQQQEADQRAIASAEKLIDSGLTGAARSVLNTVLKNDPTSGAAVHGLGLADLKDGKYESAEGLFRKAQYLAPDQDYSGDIQDARLLQRDDAAVLATADGRVKNPLLRQRGIRLLQALTDRTPSNADARLRLARALIEDKQGEKGLKQYSIAIGDANDEQLKQIADDLRELAKIAPKAGYLRQLLGKADLRLGRFDEADAALQAAGELTPENLTIREDRALVQVARGQAALEAGDVSVAMEHFLDAQSLAGQNEQVRVALAGGYLARAEQKARSGGAAGAVSDFRLAAGALGTIEDDGLRQRAAQGAFNLAQTLRHRREVAGDDIGDEIVAFQAAFDIDPKNALYRRRLAEERDALGDQYAAGGETENAAHSYQRAHDLMRGSTTYRDKAVNAFRQLGQEKLSTAQYSDAVAAYRAAFAIAPHDDATRSEFAAALNTRGLNYRTNGDNHLAAVDFREALNLFPNNSDYDANLQSVIAYL